MNSDDIMYELTHIRAELQSLRREVASLRRHLGNVDEERDTGEQSDAKGADYHEREPRTHSERCSSPVQFQEFLGDLMHDFPFAWGEDPRPSRRAGFSADPQGSPRPESRSDSQPESQQEPRPHSYPGAAEIAKFISDALAERDRRGRGGQDSDDTGRAEDSSEDETGDSDGAK
ncbi:hypothetical protein [Brevibacterium paucivorans]|uniref:hypothetical protein n=1 Tax=Brevibacterium paucivorans TaxID=170994 RepID=UPI00321BF7E5